MARKVKQPAPFTRKGLHRVTCDECQAFGYFTIATLERYLPAMPSCACGEPFRPERYELAAALDVPHPADEALETDGQHREMSQCRALGGYQKTAARMQGIGGSVPANMHHRALDALRLEEREAARSRRGRLAGRIVPVVEMAF